MCFLYFAFHRFGIFVLVPYISFVGEVVIFSRRVSHLLNFNTTDMVSFDTKYFLVEKVITINLIPNGGDNDMLS